MDNKGFEMQNEPGNNPRGKNGEIVLSSSNLQNGFSNGRVSPSVDADVATAKERQEKERAKRDREPLRFIKWITARPCLWFGEQFLSIFHPCFALLSMKNTQVCIDFQIKY